MNQNLMYVAIDASTKSMHLLRLEHEFTDLFDRLGDRVKSG